MSRDQLQGPQRIVCLTEETTETLYLVGEYERIVGTPGSPSARRRRARRSPRPRVYFKE